MKRTLPIFVLLLFAIPARAADKWTAVQSKNFLLVGNAMENQIRDVAENLELFRTAYGKFFALREKGATVGTTVIVFKSDASFRPYKPTYQGRPSWDLSLYKRPSMWVCARNRCREATGQLLPSD